MNIKATANNVILKVQKKKKTANELLIDTGEQDQIILGSIVAIGSDCKVSITNDNHVACAYLNRVALLPWETDTENFYVVKEENIYGILEV